MDEIRLLEIINNNFQINHNYNIIILLFNNAIREILFIFYCLIVQNYLSSLALYLQIDKENIPIYIYIFINVQDRCENLEVIESLISRIHCVLLMSENIPFGRTNFIKHVIDRIEKFV